MDNFDIVIVGSGMAGLVCADILGREGLKVCLLEKNKQLGGSLQTFVRDRVIFDTGVHYLGGLDEGQNLYQIFKYLGIINKLNLQKQDEVFDIVGFYEDNSEYEYAQGYDNFKAHMLKHFPDEEKAINTYCETIQDVCTKFPLYRLETSSSGLIEKTPILEIGTKDFIDSLTENERLRDVLAGNNALYAGQADKTPLYVHALILNSYIESSYKCVDGGSQISKYIAQNIKRHGGTIIRNCEVKRFVEENKRIAYVETAKGEKIYGDKFISNIHPVKTLELTKSEVIKTAYRSRLKGLENSVSSFSLNIVFKEDSFPYFSQNYYVGKEGHVWDSANYTADNWPLGYAAFMAPTSKQGKYADGMSILAYMRFEEVEPWKDTFNTVSQVNDRGETYEEFKTRKAELLLDMVEKKFPDIRSHIKSYYSATPLSYRDYIGNDDGSLYGIVKDYNAPLNTFISPRTKIPNLYFTGQNLNLHGILGTAVSAIVTCINLLESDSIVAKIRNA